MSSCEPSVRVTDKSDFKFHSEFGIFFRLFDFYRQFIVNSRTAWLINFSICIILFGLFLIEKN